jgi:uridylate kinase
MKISLSLGGSLLTGKNKEPYIQLTPDNYRLYAETLKELHGQGHEIMAVCGGGKPARHFIDISKQLGGTRDVQDLLGIKASHVNALLMMSALGGHADQNRIYQRASDLRYAPAGRILVGGGYRPGSSTDYRAVIFAEKMGADLIINATDVPGVYDKNPRKHPDAVKLKELTYDQLEKIIKENTRQAPGEYGLFDLKAVKRARRAGIPVVFIDGTDPQEINRAVNGTHSGSTVKG